MSKFSLYFAYFLLVISVSSKFMTVPKEVTETTTKDLKTEILAAINKVRIYHGSPDLEWDEGMEEIAKKKLEDYKTKDGFFRVDKGIVYSIFDEEANGETPVKSWEEDEKYYDFTFPHVRDNSLFFVTLVWKSAKKVGCAFGKTEKEENIVICKIDIKEEMTNGNFAVFRANVRPIYTNFVEQMYERINYYRKQHNAKALEVDEKLEEKARKYSLLKVKGEKGTEIIKNLGRIGADAPEIYEYAGYGVINALYKEKKGYDFKEGKIVESNAKFFTQIVWKASTEIGCAVVKGDENYLFICLFKEKGNKKSKMKENVEDISDVAA